MPAIRVVLADDHPIVRSGIRSLLERSDDIYVVGEASTGQEALRLVAECSPDVLLLDMEMPDMNGAEVVRKVKASGNGVRILVLSAHDDQHYIQELFALGISGYLLKEEAPEIIIEAVQGTARGEKGWMSRRVASQLTNALRPASRDKYGLTRREREVLQAVVNGKTNQEIGLLLSVSEKTVEKHIYSILNKLGVSTRVEAAVMAVRGGWFTER